MGLLREAATDDTTGKGSSTRIALLSVALVLEGCLVFAIRQYALTGREGWGTIINTLCVCLSTVLVGYASKMIREGMQRKDKDEPPQVS